MEIIEWGKELGRVALVSTACSTGNVARVGVSICFHYTQQWKHKSAEMLSPSAAARSALHRPGADGRGPFRRLSGRMRGSRCQQLDALNMPHDRSLSPSALLFSPLHSALFLPSSPFFAFPVPNLLRFAARFFQAFISPPFSVFPSLAGLTLIFSGCPRRRLINHFHPFHFLLYNILLYVACP